LRCHLIFTRAISIELFWPHWRYTPIQLAIKRRTERCYEPQRQNIVIALVFFASPRLRGEPSADCV
jgi:hypothetical protein